MRGLSSIRCFQPFKRGNESKQLGMRPTAVSSEWNKAKSAKEISLPTKNPLPPLFFFKRVSNKGNQVL